MDPKENNKPTHPVWMNEEALVTLSKSYLLKGETVFGMYERVAKHSTRTLKGLGYGICNSYSALEQDFVEILQQGWLGLSSPVAANFGTARGLPVSCYATHLADSVSSIYSHLKETAQLTKQGGGVGVYYGNIRPTGSPFGSKQGENGKSSGVLPWALAYDLTARTVSQGGVRRGSFAHYLPIDHPDVEDLLRAKDHTQGDPRALLDSNLGLTVTDDWLQSMLDGNEQKRKLFVKVLKTRFMAGSPYLVFIDNVNRANPLAYKERGLWVSTSNLCSEITLHTDDNHTFVCVLSSINLAKYREWDGWVSRTGLSLPQLGIYLLEAVQEDFINKASRMVTMGRSVRSARKGRALGLGVMGLHQLYQQEDLPFASEGAKELNRTIFHKIKQDAVKASRTLAGAFGEPDWCKGTGMRHTHLLAIAPTRTNAMIAGAGSQGIEPHHSNFYVGKQSSGSYVRKNTALEKVLVKYNQNTQQTWDSIRDHQGSVQHLDFMSEHHRAVYQTAFEIDQMEIIKQAADRQQYICQAQSLNLFVQPDLSLDDLAELHLKAWALKLKSLYYLKTKALNTTSLTKKHRCPYTVLTKTGCKWCVKVKQLLIQQGETIREIDCLADHSFGKWSTYPQVFLNERRIGGYEDTAKHLGVSVHEEECKACEG